MSERTIYRRFAAIRDGGNVSLELIEKDLQRRANWRCKWCGAELAADADFRTEYCEGACRQAAFRARRRREQRRSGAQFSPRTAVQADRVGQSAWRVSPNPGATVRRSPSPRQRRGPRRCS